jgi:hypothetical protein
MRPDRKLAPNRGSLFRPEKPLGSRTSESHNSDNSDLLGAIKILSRNYSAGKEPS